MSAAARLEHSPVVTIIIPTYDNRAYLEPCLQSLLAYTDDVHYQVIVVNNGQRGTCDFARCTRVRVIEAGGNRGWEGGLQLGLDRSGSPYALFLNDDTLFLRTQKRWLFQLLSLFGDPTVAAVGPTSNMVSGVQRVVCTVPEPCVRAPYLIGFCLLVRRDCLELVGGIDHTLPGGDDIDLSIRLQLKGWRLLCHRRVFVFHHGYITGTRVHGPASDPDGWNSPAFTRRVAEALIAKHGAAVVEQMRAGMPL